MNDVRTKYKSLHIEIKYYKIKKINLLVLQKILF